MRVNVGDVELFYEVYGSKLICDGANTKEKPTFIFLHGGAGFLDHTPYVNFWSRFADIAEVIFIDQRGSGRSICHDVTTWNLKQWGQDIHKFCEALHIKKPIVGGISYGGMVAMSYNIQYPDEPLALILSDTDVHIDREYMLQLVASKLKEHGKSVEEGVAITNRFLDGPLTEAVFSDYFYKILTLFGKPVEVIDDFSLFDPKLVNFELGQYFLNGELLSFDYRDKLKNTHCPVLFLSGNQGPLHSLKTAKELIAAFPQDKIQYKIFEDAKPACYEADPKEAEKIIKIFIKSLC
jgi:pimeloyl-ACP methyl ester carboxylesterase